eukprot:11216884-Lingulodinium_polyedra.AAC.1
MARAFAARVVRPRMVDHRGPRCGRVCGELRPGLSGSGGRALLRARRGSASGPGTRPGVRFRAVPDRAQAWSR